jgi:membrane protease YdiL (CAAX protease family)
VTTCYAPPQGRWGLWDIGWFTLVVIGAIILTALLLVPVAIRYPEALQGADINGATAAGAWLLALSQLLFFAGMAAWPLIVGAWKSEGWRRAFGFVLTWRSLWVGLVGGFATLVLMIVLTDITARVLHRDINSAGADVAATMTGSHIAYVLFLLLIAVGAPFVEELSFRGLVWGAFVKRGWSPWVASVLAGVPFMLLHLEPLRIAPLLAAGIALGVIRQFGGLSGSMLAHAVVNVIGVIGILAS